MLELERLRCTAGGRRILDDVSLQVGDGSILSLLGPSGSGKTTVLRSAIGLVVPEGGRCRFAGAVLSDAGRLLVPPEARGFAFLFQNFTLFPHLRVRQNILIGVRDLTREERARRLERTSGLLGLGSLLDREIHDLSGGEQQRVALARTLVMEPKLLLLDEPFSNLDKMTRFRLYGDIKRTIREAGMSAILATHDQEEAYFFSDRMAVMADGRIIAHGEPSHIYRDPGGSWLARFTGEANILSAADMDGFFPGWRRSDTAQGDRWLVRPEQVLLRTPTSVPPACHISEVTFFGRFSSVDIVGPDNRRLSAVVAGPTSWRTGDGVELALSGPPAELKA